MDDREIIDRSHRLVAEEDGLHEPAVGTLLQDTDQRRLRQIEEGLEGLEPVGSAARPVDTVEAYEQ
ncbi:MAG: hypothetical protein H0V19_04915 [Euzebyales bacterium]|nr:hypothetical protein [Euzebyales bacterium]